MRTGEQLTLTAMKREFNRLSKIAAKAKAEADEYNKIGSEFIAIHEELAKIVNSGEHGQKTLDQLEALKKRRDKANKILKKDFMKLLDRESKTEIERDTLGREIHNLEWRLNLRTNNQCK